MTDAKVSQVQQATQLWAGLFAEQLGRFESACGEVAKLEEKSLAQMQSATNDAFKLMSSTMTYGAELAASYRKLAVDAARQGLNLMTFGA
jgi:hypothetical protein